MTVNQISKLNGIMNGISPSLIDSIIQHSITKSDDLAFSQVSSNILAERSLTYSDLVKKSNSVANKLRTCCLPGDRVVIMFHGGTDFVISFVGCLIAGVLAVPGYPVREPGSSGKPARNYERLLSIVEDASPTAILTDRATVERVITLSTSAPAFSGVRWISVEDIEFSGDDDSPPRPSNGDTAFLQYTSGSTSDPKGVMVSNANLISLFNEMNISFQHRPSSVMISWVPVYHDLGLIYGILLPLYYGFPIYSLLPAAVLQQPFRWLQAISRFRGTHSAAPNFAFDLCSHRITDSKKQDLELSSWQACINGAETVRPATLRRFAESFAKCGLRPDVIRPGYGLAECTLTISTVKIHDLARDIWLDGPALERGEVMPLDNATLKRPSSRNIQSCGWTHIDADIRIVDPVSREQCSAGSIGEIWVSSANVTQGYWNRPEATKATMQARLASGEGSFLRTGDLGIISENELYVTGRIKDLIILRGRNIYPQDIEATAQTAHRSVRAGRCCAFSIELDGAEALVLVSEIERVERRDFDSDAVFRAIREAISRDHEILLHDIVFVNTGTFPLTSSGKVQRQLARSEYLQGSLMEFARMKNIGEGK